MNLYYCIADLLTRLEADAGELKVLIPVTRTIPHCDGFAEDAFILGSQPNLLDTTSRQGAESLAALIAEVSLYRYNMELALDEALAERHANPVVRRALEHAFAGQVMPNTLRGGKTEDDLHGSLRHPMLEHLTAEQLAGIYLGFLEVHPGETPYGFARAILGKHPERFAALFDGFVDAKGGEVRAEILLAFGMRADEPEASVTSYLDAGQRKARQMDIREARELMWAWLEADHYQMRRCRDIHRLKMLPGLPRMPNWLRADIFAVLEKESMKQAFASHVMADANVETLLAQAPHVRRAVAANAEGQVDELLQQLLAQTLNLSTAYSGAAGKFAAAAMRREAEAKQIRLT